MPLRLDVIQKYTARTFVETGTYEGEGIDRALTAGFKRVHSMDVDGEKIKGARARFANNRNVRIYHGASTELLPRILPRVRDLVTFWLDAHGSQMLNLTNCPTADELRLINQYKLRLQIKAILIDDMRLFSVEDQRWFADTLHTMFPAANILREPGIQDNDVLVAYFG